MLFIQDRSLRLNGYQVDFESLEQGLFYFTHTVKGCNSTMALEARDFFDLNPGKRYQERRTGKKECPRYCLDENQLDRCEARCECAFVRDIIGVVNKHK